MNLEQMSREELAEALRELLEKEKEKEKEIARLKIAEAKSAGIVSISADAIISIDEDQRITVFNEGAEKIFGYSKAEAIGAPLDILIPERLRAIHRQHVGRFAAGPEIARRMGERGAAILGRRKNGQEFPAEAAISKLDVDGTRILTVAVRDVTEQKRAQDEVRQTRERLALALEGADLGLWDWNIKTGEVIFNPRWAEMRGFRPDEVSPHVDSWLSGIHPDDRLRVEKVLTDYFQGLGAGYETEHRVLTKSGRWLWVLDRGKVFARDEDGQPTRMVGTELDITERKRLEQELRLSEEKASGIVSISADAIISIDEEQRITLFNDGAEKVFGYSRAEAIGTPLDMLIPEQFRSAHRHHVENFAAGDVAARRMGERNAEIAGRRKNGEVFPAEAAISKIEIGGKRLFTVSLRDITERKRIENEQRFLSEVGAVLAATLDYTTTLTSIVRLGVRRLADCVIADIVQDESHVERREVVHVDPGKISLCERLKQIHLDPRRPYLGSAAIETKEPFLLSEVSTDYLRTIAQSDEHLRVLQELDPKSVMAVPLLAHGRLLGSLVFISSHSSRRYRESELQLAQELAHRAALVIDNARLHEAAQRAIQARDEVLGVVAHDLRNPLGSILMQAALLRPRDGETERRSRIPAERIERAATRMNRLIQDLIDVTRMEGGRLSIEQVRVPAERVVSDSAEAQKLLASSASLEIQLDVTTDLPDIWADRDRLLQVFENLISNAVKFTKAGGRITVGAAPREGEVLFWVADTGVGIGGGDLPHLFDRFWQARKAGRQGAGLGLPIVKGIIEAHGGRIWVESQVGVGSTFFFTLPLARSERGTAEVPGVTCTENHAATRKQPAAESRQPARVVLVAEDDLDVREALCGTLERAGYKVATAANGAEALEYLHREAAPFLVILDLKMPVMDGWAFLTERNRDPDLRSIPVIVVSGERDIKDRVAAAHASYIQKPILPKRLFETMEHVLP